MDNSVHNFAEFCAPGNVRCTACGKKFGGPRVHRCPPEKTKPPSERAGFTVTICTGCGHLMKRTLGGPVDLTKAEKARLTLHAQVDKIRREQDRIVAKMWG